MTSRKLLTAETGRRFRLLSMEVLALDSNNADAPAFLAAAEQVSETQIEPDTSRVSSTPQPSGTPSTQPTSFADGRYQIKEFLGEGGRKRVDQAQDTVLDRDVALAVIKTEGLLRTMGTMWTPPLPLLRWQTARPLLIPVLA